MIVVESHSSVPSDSAPSVGTSYAALVSASTATAGVRVRVEVSANPLVSCP